MSELQSLSKGGCLIDFLLNYQYNVINWEFKSEARLEIKDTYRIFVVLCKKQIILFIVIKAFTQYN